MLDHHPKQGHGPYLDPKGLIFDPKGLQDEDGDEGRNHPKQGHGPYFDPKGPDAMCVLG